MPILRHTLPNGLPTILVPTAHGHLVHAAAFIRMGSCFEPAEEAGISHFVEHLLFQGSERFRNSAELCAFVEERGGEVNAHTTPDFTQVYVNLHNAYAREGIEALGALTLGPAVDRWDVERERRIILNERATGGPDADADMRARLWPGHPLARDVSGEHATVSAFTTAQLASHYRTHLRPRNMVVVIAGAFNAKALAPVLRDVFGAYPDAGNPVPQPLSGNGEHPAPQRLVLDSPGGGCGVMAALPVCGMTSPDVLPLQAANFLLGGGLSSRLFLRLREREGLAYEVGSVLSHFTDRGYLLVHAACTRDHSLACTERLLDEVREFGQGGVTEAEMARMHRFVQCQTDFRSDDPVDLAQWHGLRELFGTPTNAASLEEEAAAFHRLTRDDVNAVLARWLRPEAVTVVCHSDGGWRHRRRLRRVVEAGMNWSPAATRGEGA